MNDRTSTGKKRDEELYAIKETTKEGYKFYYTMNRKQLNTELEKSVEKSRNDLMKLSIKIESIKKMSIWQFIKWRNR